MFWYPRQVEQCLTDFSISAFIFTHAGNLVFSIPTWLLCSCFNICIHNWDGIITLLPFIVTPSIMTNSCLMGQFFVCLVPHVLFCVANPLWYMPLALASVHLLLLHLVYLILIYTLAGPLLWLLHSCLCLGLISLYLCPLCCVMISNLQWIDLGLPCIVCVPCTGVCTQLCIADIVIMLPHLCPL